MCKLSLERVIIYGQGKFDAGELSQAPPHECFQIGTIFKVKKIE